MSRAQGLSSSSTASLQAQRPRSPLLGGAHPRSLRLSGPAPVGKGRHGLAQGLLLVPPPGATAAGGSPVARSWRGCASDLALRGREASRRGGRAAKLPSAYPGGPPSLLPPPPPARRHFVRSRCDTHNSRPGSPRKGSGPPRYGLPPSNPLVPTRQRSYLCLPDYQPDPTCAPHS